MLSSAEDEGFELAAHPATLVRMIREPIGPPRHEHLHRSVAIGAIETINPAGL
jgi:hypothetical protein